MKGVKLHKIICPNAGLAVFLVAFLEHMGFPTVWTSDATVVTMAPKSRVECALNAMGYVA